MITYPKLNHFLNINNLELPCQAKMDKIAYKLILYSLWRIKLTYDPRMDELILAIVETENIAEQSELQQSLKNRGYEVPQATISRRLKKLKIVKVEGYYKATDIQQPGLPLVLNIKTSDYGLIILHTHPGNANSLAYYLDRKYVAFTPQALVDAPLLGTVAGDDTVLLILKSRNELTQVMNLLQEEFPYLVV